MNWYEMLASKGIEELRDLLLYLGGEEPCNRMDQKQLIQKILYGKKRYLFYMIDKQAWKTLKRLVRHPDRPLNRKYYSVEQLLKLNFIEEMPLLEEDHKMGWFQICQEAIELSEQLNRTRYYDPLILQMKRIDEILLGLLHSFGFLELQQCKEMLHAYDIDLTSERLFALVTWRLSICEELQAFEISRQKGNTAVIMMRGIKFIEAASAVCMIGGQYEYELCQEAELRSRKERYFALSLPEFEVLQEQLIKRLSRRFVKAYFYQLIDTYQYHITEFTEEAILYRVFDQTMIGPYIEAVKDALPDIYRKGHSAWSPSP